MTIRTPFLALCLVLLSIPPALSKGSVGNKHDPLDPNHVDNLPPDVRRYVAGICRGTPVAQHDFATYSPQEKRWRINLEYLQCSVIGEYRKGNQCMDVDFVAEGAHFRLVRKTYAACGF
ncbi:hypothetical protein J2R76_000251 [Bradyrhizobium sp. USDA 4532]|uniref:hypothetical protein n=1 Tax=unclassified Bradyrhizobium TaxID=2631580 RepID=UPI00209E1FC5|nr:MULTISPECIES: hypothetical protein [unclassified Bradyrhizobium]MCP1831824.1 hypothetical protein [Bradyrhizobium sp. USDA 4545]MCP1916660.1 hypothetical protein [Bradyrhizobium sp. USDA 4532]